MTPTTNTFGSLAMAALTVFALWTSTLAIPVSAAATTAPSVSATSIVA